MSDDQAIVGDWVLSSFRRDEVSQQQSTINKSYSADGQFCLLGGYIISAIDDDTQLRSITAAFEETGTWKLAGNTILEDTITSETHFFSSALEEFDRDAFDNDESRSETTVYLIQTDEGDLKQIREEQNLDELLQMQRVESAISKPDFLRQVSQNILKQDGFACSSDFPIKDLSRPIRSHESIAQRMVCFYTAICWVTSPLPSRKLKKLIKIFNLEKLLTNQEREILNTSRRKAKSQHAGTIGWRIENVWMIAWVLGFDETPDIDQGQIVEEVIVELVAFIEAAIADSTNFFKELSMRSQAELIQMEDLFFCGCNAIRAGSIPKGFELDTDGRVIQEKCHAISWILSPDEKWDDVSIDA